MKKVDRATLRDKPLAADCYRAYASRNEYMTESVTVTGCYGLMRDRYNYRRECEECGAFVHGDIGKRLRELEIEVDE